MNAINEIINKADSVFEQAWTHERDRWSKIADMMTEWNTNISGNPIPNSRHKKSKFFDAPCDEFVAVKLMGWSIDEVHNIYNYMKASQYDKMKSAVRELHDLNRKGLDAFLSDKRSQYFDMLTAKLKQALEKHLSNDWKVDSAYDIDLRNSEKGYTIFTRLISNLGDQAYLETNCIPAGGWNIQVFHYRYRSNFKILED